MTRWRAELVLERDGQIVNTVRVPGVLMAGRGLDNDLILADKSVSSRHALFYTVNGVDLRVRDLGSANGTWLAGERITSSVALRDGDLVRLGASAILRVCLREAAPIPNLPLERAGLLEDLTAGVRYPIPTDVILIGEAEHCHVRLPRAEPVEATLTLYETGEIRVGRKDEDETSLEVGEVFEVAGHQLVVRPDVEGGSTFRAPITLATADVALSIDLTQAGGGVARFSAAHGGPVVEITSENRVALLYVLARRIRDDRAKAVPPEEVGWCTDASVMQGVWGRQWENQEWNTYQVLLFRIRKELKAVGFDGWIVEKRKGHTRLRVQRVDLLPP